MAPLKKMGRMKAHPNPTELPVVICDAGFFDNRYANMTLIFHKSEKQGKGLDLGFRDNN